MRTHVARHLRTSCLASLPVFCHLPAAAWPGCLDNLCSVVLHLPQQQVEKLKVRGGGQGVELICI